MAIWLGTDVLLHENRTPILYDHQSRPLQRVVGFHPQEMNKMADKKKLSFPKGLDVGKARIAEADKQKGFKRVSKGVPGKGFK